MLERTVLKLVVIILITLGTLIARGHVGLIHWYHYQRVSEKDMPKYCCVMGSSLWVIGLSEAIPLVLDSSLGVGLMLLGCGVGLAIMTYGQFRYNHGFF